MYISWNITIQKQDYHLVPVDPDPDFDLEHNKRVVEETIAWNEKLRKNKQAEINEQVRERAEAVAQYLKSSEQGRKTTDIEKYFGRRHLSYLRGQQIMERLKDQLTTVDANGKILRKPAWHVSKK